MSDRLDNHVETPDVLGGDLTFLFANHKNVTGRAPRELSNFLARVVADQLNLETSLLILCHLVDIDTVSLSVEGVITLICF
jgi:hypothetical protein